MLQLTSPHQRIGQYFDRSSQITLPANPDKWTIWPNFMLFVRILTALDSHYLLSQKLSRIFLPETLIGIEHPLGTAYNNRARPTTGYYLRCKIAICTLFNLQKCSLWSCHCVQPSYF